MLPSPSSPSAPSCCCSHCATSRSIAAAAASSGGDEREQQLRHLPPPQPMLQALLPCRHHWAYNYSLWGELDTHLLDRQLVW